MRGKDLFVFYILSSSRITPAYAGKRTITDPQKSLSQDHPRLCGEKAF